MAASWGEFILVYSMACPARCDFCCHPVEDYGPGKIDAAEAIDWIRQAADIETIGLVVFTGGEPMLHVEDLIEILEASRGLGLRFRIVTSAHWARSRDVALDVLRPLHERGLAELSISTDPAHQRFVPAKYAENAAHAALELGIVAEFAGVFWNPEERIEDTVDVPPNALTTRGLVAPVGRASKHDITAARYGLSGQDRFFGCDARGRYELTVYPDGEVYPCCSGGFNVKAGLSFGNLRTSTLADIVAAVRTDRYTGLVRKIGLMPVYAVAELKFPELFARLPDYSQLTGVCELCALVHADPRLLGDLAPVLEYVEHVVELHDDMLARAGGAGAPRAAPKVGGP